VPVTPESHARTRAFARIIGPWLVIVPGVIAVRAPDMSALAADFFKSPLFIWFSGALLLFAGLLIIAFHQHWSSVAAVLISLFGWVLALRGVALLAAPALYERVGTVLEAVSVIRSIFGVLVAIGIYLTYVGWIAKPAALPVIKKP
jgi:hypothetical protein